MRNADVLVLMVVNSAQAESVLFESGALDQLAAGAVVVVMATCPPDAVRALAARVEKTGPAVRGCARLWRHSRCTGRHTHDHDRRTQKAFDAAHPFCRAWVIKYFMSAKLRAWVRL